MVATSTLGEDELERIRAVASEDESVVFVYLFGSAATGKATQRSDIDLAVYLDADVSLYDEAHLHDRFAKALQRDDVDLVVLNRAPLWLQFRVLGDGMVVFSRDERRRIAYRAKTEHAFLDFRPYYEAYLAAVRDRARSGRLSAGGSCPVDQLLALLSEYVRILASLAEVPPDEFERDPRNYGSAERFLQLAIETTLHVGHHILAAQGLPHPQTYPEVFATLGTEGVLDRGFAKDLEPMARMRNRLVHVYEDINPGRVHELLGTRLEDFERFSEQVTSYLDRIDRIHPPATADRTAGAACALSRLSCTWPR